MNVEFVPLSDTVADLTLSHSQSASLRTSNSILLALVLISSFILNVIIIATVFTNRKLRESTIYLLLCHHSFIQLFDLMFSVFFSLLYVANEEWLLGMTWCRVNSAMQQFCQLYTLMSLMLMAAERAVGLVVYWPTLDISRARPDPVFTLRTLSLFSLILATVCTAMSVPLLTPAIPVRPFKNRFICAIDANCPIGFSIVRIIMFSGCLVVQLVCVGAIFKKRGEYSLPQGQQVSDFIKTNRAKQEFVSRAKLIIFMLVIFILVEGPYTTLSFVYEMANSVEILSYGQKIDVPEDADILITWLRFLYPLLSSITVLSWCSDIWIRVKELFCCKSYEPPTIGNFMGHPNGVLTLVATPEGLQLRLPASTVPTVTQMVPTHQPPPPAFSPRIERSPSPDLHVEEEFSSASILPPSPPKPRIVKRTTKKVVASKNPTRNTDKKGGAAQRRKAEVPKKPPRAAGNGRSK